MKYHVLDRSNWKRCTAVEMPKRTVKAMAAARDGSYR
jgi:hypothetical protein